jgi:hypothetical protein
MGRPTGQEDRRKVMSTIGVELRTHGTRREAFCLICGALHEEECVAAVLVRDGEPIGDVCPRCLEEGPARGGRRLRERAARMAERARRVELRGGARPLVDVVRDQSEWLVVLADELRGVEGWGVTPDELRLAERSALQERFPQMTSGVLSRLVEGRHARHLAAAPGGDCA